MNRTIALAGSILLATTVAIFFVCLGVSLFVRHAWLDNISFLVCIFLSWGYLIASAGSSHLADAKHRLAADVGKLMAVVYAVFICLVYFTQLTVVRQQVLDPDIVAALTFAYPGSWLFAIDIAGYGIMAISTFFVGLSITPRNTVDRALKILLLIHGIFFLCMFLPMTSMFLGETMSLNIGSLALMGWCIIFFPIGVLFCLRFYGDAT